MILHQAICPHLIATILEFHPPYHPCDYVVGAFSTSANWFEGFTRPPRSQLLSCRTHRPAARSSPGPSRRFWTGMRRTPAWNCQSRGNRPRHERSDRPRISPEMRERPLNLSNDDLPFVTPQSPFPSPSSHRSDENVATDFFFSAGGPAGGPGEKIACRSMPGCAALSSFGKPLPQTLCGSLCRLVPRCATLCRFMPKTPNSLWGSRGRGFESRRPDLRIGGVPRQTLSSGFAASAPPDANQEGATDA